MKDWVLKLLSLVLAMLLAYVVTSDGNSGVFTFVSSVDVRNVPSDRVLIGPANRQVQVTIRGPSFVAAGILAHPPLVRLSLPANAEENQALPVRRTDLDLPPFVEVLSISPPEISFELDRLVSKVVPVNVPRIGSTGEALRLERVAADPSSITIFGPARMLEGIKSIESDPIDLRNLEQSTRRVLQLRIPPSVTKTSQSEVNVAIDIAPILVPRIFAGLPVEVRAMPGQNFMVVPAMVTVEVRAARSLMESLRAGDLIPYIRLTQEGEVGNDRIKVALDLPPGIEIVRVDPPTVQVLSSVAGRGNAADAKGTEEKRTTPKIAAPRKGSSGIKATNTKK